MFVEHLYISLQTVKVQGNDISHKLQISRVGKSDEGLYECRVTNANYGELLEYKVQAYLKVNSTRPRIRLAKKTSPLSHLTADKKPRKTGATAAQDSMSPDLRVRSTSSSQTSSAKTIKQSSGETIKQSSGEITPQESRRVPLRWVPVLAVSCQIK